jgi:hypothetical protein
MLFVGEAPPASGLFFYKADSGLYRAIRDTFVDACPNVGKDNFLKSFQELGCYLVDLCGKPVDRMNSKQRRRACRDGEVRLAKILKQLRPKIVITVLRSIAANVRRSESRAAWSGRHIELPYPGRWIRHRTAFLATLKPILRECHGSKPLSKTRARRGAGPAHAQSESSVPGQLPLRRTSLSSPGFSSRRVQSGAQSRKVGRVAVPA